MKIITKLGKDLTVSELKVINEWRYKEFKSAIWNAKNSHKYADSRFFILKENSSIVAFCRLRNINLFINEIKYEILGLASVISIIKRKGYGKELIKGVTEFVNSQEKTLIGFCGSINREFYKKCGFDIIEDAQDRFIYIDAEGKHIADEGDVIFYGKDSSLFALIKNNPGLQIFHYIPHW